MAERGSVARATFDRIQALVADGMSLKAAFAKLSDSSGRSAGTIQAAYYRYARKVGAVNERLGRPSKTAATRGRSAPRKPRTLAAAALLSDLAKRLADAATALQALAAEVGSLERDAAAWRDVKRLVAG